MGGQKGKAISVIKKGKDTGRQGNTKVSRRNVGRPKVSEKDCRKISFLLSKENDVPTIVKQTGKSQTTVERIRAALNALVYTVPVDEREDSGYVRDAEWQKAEGRTKRVEEKFTVAQRKAILAGLVDAKVSAKDLMDPIPPESVRGGFIPQKIDPQHAPILSRKKYSPQ